MIVRAVVGYPRGIEEALLVHHAVRQCALGRERTDVEVRITDALPMTPTRKIAKAELAALAAS